VKRYHLTGLSYLASATPTKSSTLATAAPSPHCTSIETKRAVSIKCRLHLATKTSTHKATMSTATLYRNGFEVDFAHKDRYERLAIYDDGGVSSNAQRHAPEATKHTGSFSAVKSKAHILKESTQLLRARFTLLPGFSFRSGNAVLFGLRIVTPDGGAKDVDFMPILKAEHSRLRRNASTVFSWAEVPLSQADEGTMSISVTRGNCDTSMATFVPLVGADGTPYTVEVAWRLPGSQMSPEVVVTPEVFSREQIAQKFATSRKQAESARPTQVQKATEPQRTRGHHGVFGSSTETTVDTQNSGQALSSDETEGFGTTPSTVDKTPGQTPSTVARGRPEILDSTPTIADNTLTTEPRTSKRRATNTPGPNNERHIKRLRFRLRKAEAVLEVANARTEETASQVDKADPSYLQTSLSRAEAVYDLVKVELELRTAEGSDEKSTEFLRILTRKAEAYLVVVEAEEELELATELRE
jgi:hypothetical protein